jgi:hypothetical protein
MTIRAIGAIAFLVTLLFPLPASAHEEVFVGDYTLEIGWLVEPVLLGGTNGVFISVVNTQTEEPVDGINALQVAISTGGETRDLELRSLGEDAPGQYAADFIPTVRGVYTVKLTGRIEEQGVDLEQQIEEVGLAEDLQFPVVLPSLPELSSQVSDLTAQLAEAQARATTAQTLAFVGIVLGVVGAGLGVYGLVKQK